MNATGPIAVPEPSKQAAPKKPKPKSKAQRESRPSKLLPTERITVAKQLEILRGYAAASSNGASPVSLEKVAAVVDMATTTISLANPFLVSVSLISKTDAGFSPAAEVISFLRAFEWNPETASYKLAPIIERSWFFEAIRPRLSFSPQDEQSILDVLAETAAASPDYKKNLQMLIEFTVQAGLVQREGNQLKLAKPSTASLDSPQNGGGKAPEVSVPDQPSKNKIVTTAFAKTAEGAVHFNVSVRVEMAEFAGWQPDRITAFFNGIAEVLKAKANVEEEAGS